MTQLTVKEIPKSLKRFKVALSFPGEKRSFIESVANLLKDEFGEGTIFYDNFFKHEIARFNADLYLADVYKEKSELIAVFLCEEYQQKEWCGVEWGVIRDMKKEKRSDEIMLFKFDKAKVDGLNSNDGYIDVSEIAPQDVVKEIIKRIKSNQIDNETNSISLSELSTNTSRNSNNYFKPDNKSQRKIDYIYDLFYKIKDELNFIPISILKNVYPFRIESNKNSVDYRAFNLLTNNEDIFYLFNSIVDINGKIDLLDTNRLKRLNLDIAKLKFVLGKLTQNLIFSISNGNYRSQINIYYREKVEKSNIISDYNNFLFHTAIENSIIRPEGLQEKLSVAYINYKIGNYFKAKELYEEICEQATKENKHIILFISKYNLFQLGIFIRGIYWTGNNYEKTFEELRGIDLKKISNSLNSKKTNSFYDLLESGEFFNKAYNEINNLVNQIIDQYHSHLNGGISYNNNSSELLNVFAELDSFLNTNYIIYDGFGEFENLFQRVIEGLFASHAISNQHESRLAVFDDYWITKIIYYGKKDNIVKYFNRYKLKELNYEQTSFDNDSFYDLSRNLLDNISKTSENLKEIGEDGNRKFREKFGKFFENTFTVAALLNLNNESINGIAALLVKFMNSEDLIFWHKYSSVNDFIRRKGSKIDIKILKNIFDVVLSRGKLHEHGLIQSILDKIAVRDEIKISAKNLNLFVNNSFVKCKDCQKTHSKEDIFSLYIAVDVKNKKKIIDIITKILNASFDSELFYLALMYDTIPFNEIYFEKYIEEVKIKYGSKANSKPFLGTNQYSNYQISNIINLCFKENISLTEVNFDFIRNFNEYYKWLTDMENYDYSKFEPEWILEYDTVFFREAMKKSKRLLRALVEYLGKTSNSQIENMLIRITYYAERN